MVGEKCYLFKKNNIDFHRAEKSCKQMNAKLFEPQDLETNNLVFNISSNVSKEWDDKENWRNYYIYFWIGIHDTNSEGNFSYLRLGPFKIIWLSCRAMTKSLSILYT